MKRHIYLAMKPLAEAREIFLKRFAGEKGNIGRDEIAIEQALGRVLAEPVFARFSTPSYHAAAMDGVAVRAEQTFGVSERNPRILKIGAEALWVNTGQALPEGFNAVIMVEKLHQLNEESLEIRAPAFPWQHIRKVGEDIVATQLLLPQNHLIRPYDVGAMITAGIYRVKVWQRPRVAIIPSGSELVRHQDLKDQPAAKGRIIEYNSYILAGLVKECLAEPIVYDIVPDIAKEIRKALAKAVDSDAHLILINAGSSAGSKDYTADIIQEMGEVLVHGVAMMPGKPTILGVIKNKPVAGNPGYTVSATLSFQQFVRPLLFQMQGLKAPQEQSIRVRPSHNIPSKLGMEEFLRVNIGRVSGRYVATPLPRAAGSITTLTRAEGILRIPADSEGVTAEEEVAVELLVAEEDLQNTLTVIGSHDITLDILADEIRRQSHNIRISSGNVGSLGGILAIRNGLCHMAGTHLLDPESGEYNVLYIKKYLQGKKVQLFHLVLREQGLMVPKGNPKAVQGVRDLAGKGLLFVNRQAGSGTRVLFDDQIKRLGIEPGSIKGYDQEEFTHMAVAVDVLSHAADCGMGIYAAARALDLDFIPVAQEQYDLIIPVPLLDQEPIRLVLAAIRSQTFRERVKALGGYDPSRSGEFWMEIG
jgi:putative molybdopterin biosynthesis protein